MFATRSYRHLKTPTLAITRTLTTLPNNKHIYVFPDPSGSPGTSLLTYLTTTPPSADLSIGTTTSIPPTPSSFAENPHFLQILRSVCADHSTQDPEVRAQAKVLSSPGGSNLGSGGVFFGVQQQQNKRRGSGFGGGGSGGGGGAGGGGAGGSSAQGGMGGAGRGGWVHVSDNRNPPDWGRIAWSEDILGSVEVDESGGFVGPTGNFQWGGMYRIITPEGILGLSPFLTEKLVERLKEIEKSLSK